MIKHIFLAGLLALLPLSTAQAAIYGGLDLDLDSTDFKSTANPLFSESTIGPQIHFGYHLGSLGVELGYGTSRKTEQQTDLRFDHLTADGIYYIPVGGFLNLLVTAGMSQTNFGASTFTELPYTASDGTIKETRAGTTILNGDEFDWRGGGGLSFAFANGYEFHVIGRYEPLTMKGNSNYTLSVATGFNIDLN